MTLEFELYEEKRRKIRRASFLKGSIVTLVVMTVGFFLLNREMVSSPHIATYKIFGTIYDDPERQVILKQIADDDHFLSR